MEVDVEPPEFYPIIDKFIVARIEEGFSALGARVRRVRVGVVPEDGKLGLDVHVILEKESGLLPEELPVFTSSLLEKAIENANESFGSWNNVRFYLKRLKVREVEEESRPDLKNVRLSVPSPVEREKTEKLAKGLLLWLIDRNFIVRGITVELTSLEPPAFKITIELENELDPVERKKLADAVVDKTTGYAETLFGSKPVVESVDVLSPAGNTPLH